mgnify:CR=1 FL=1
MAGKREVPITGSVLAWARSEAGYTVPELAARLTVSPATVASWESEEARPGLTEFGRILEAVRRPSAIFYMDQPPTGAGMPMSFRTAAGGSDRRVSPSALREIRKARRLQEAVGWVQRTSGKAEVEVPQVEWTRSDPTEVAVGLRDELSLPITEQASWPNESAALRQWRTIYDELGVLVFALQLGKEDIRGFSAWDAYAPMIAMNTAYTPSARIFTMAHELGHLITRSDSACVDWVNPRRESDATLERWCERFAAAFVLPPRALRAYVTQAFAVSERHPVAEFETARRIARRLKVSIRATAISLVDAGLGVSDLYAIVDREAEALDFPRHGGGGGGMSLVEKRLTQYGSRVPRTLLTAVGDGRLGSLDAADYLGVTVGDLEDIGSAVGAPRLRTAG